MIQIVEIEHNQFTFGCGNNMLSAAQKDNWLQFAGILKNVPGYEQFSEIEKQLK